MGAKLFRNIFEKENHDNKTETSLPKEMEFLSYEKVNKEFNKLYLSAHNDLQAITKDPSEEMLINISQCLRKNSRFMEKCFKEAALNQYDIVDMVNDRLTHHDADYKVPGIESKHVDSFLRSSSKHFYEKQQNP